MKNLFFFGLISYFVGEPAIAATVPTQDDEREEITGPLASATRLGDAELDDQRGGFDWNGAQVSFGVDVKTVLNGELALETTMNVTSTGVKTSQFVSDQLAAANAAATQHNLVLSAGSGSSLGGAPVFLANQGQTALVQSANGAIANILVNAASNISVAQQINATINLSGYQAFRSGLTGSALASALNGAIGAATSAALGK